MIPRDHAHQTVNAYGCKGQFHAQMMHRYRTSAYSKLISSKGKRKVNGE